MAATVFLPELAQMAETPRTVMQAAAERLRLLSAEGQDAGRIRDILATGRTSRASHEDIYFCFRLLLGRDPNPEEVAGHMAAVGQQAEHLVRQFVRSREFDRRDLLTAPEGGAQLVVRDGYALYADLGDDAVGKFVVAGAYEPHVTAIFERFVKPGDVVVDIGANIGFFTMLAAHLAGPEGAVVAIEPNTSNCRLIEASRRHNRFDHVSIHCLAASEESGLLALNSAYSNGSVAEPERSLATLMRSQLVPGVRLDDLLSLDRLSFIKIDVEGFELAALSGFREHISRFKPTVVSEFTPTGMPDAAAYLRFYADLGYRLAVVGHDAIEMCADDLEIMARWREADVDHIDLLAIQKDRALFS